MSIKPDGTHIKNTSVNFIIAHANYILANGSFTIAEANFIITHANYIPANGSFAFADEIFIIATANYIPANSNFTPDGAGFTNANNIFDLSIGTLFCQFTSLVCTKGSCRIDKVNPRYRGLAVLWVVMS